MARIRTIKPDFFTSESIGALSLHARLTFAGLWTYVDDKGRAKDNPRVIRGVLWPNDEETVSSKDVERFIDELVEHDMVCRYTHDGQRYLHAINFNKHQAINKPTASKLPECSIHAKPTDPTPFGELPEDYGTTPAPLPEDSRGEVEVEVEVEVEKEGKASPSMSETASPPADPPPGDRDDIERICNHLADRVEANGSLRPPIKQTWRDAARLMLDRDKRTEADIHAAIDWCQTNEFWRGNVLSLPKLREKYDQLRLQASRERASPTTTRPASNTAYLAASMERALAAEAAEAARDNDQPTLWKALPA